MQTKLRGILSLILAVLMMTTGMALAAEETPYDRTVDMLVIGGGVAGMTTAIEAADQGCESILVVEKLGYTGGAAFVSDGILGGYETQVTKALDLHVDPKDMMADQMREKAYTLDPELTWITTEKSGETIDWLIDTVGVPFNPEVGLKPGYGNFEAIHTVAGKGAAMRAPYEAAIAARPAIAVETNSRATELIYQDGVVSGAVVMQNDKPVRIGAKAVVLTTGGYAANRELFTRLHPANAVFQAGMMPGATGDGLLMATAIGAGVNNAEQIQCYLREYENPTSQTPYMYTIFVNLAGQRFMDEKRIAQTYNQENRDALIMQYGLQGADYFYSINDHAAMTQFNLAEDAKTHAGVTIAETLDELAAAIGVDAEGLKATVDAWNEMVKAQADTEFGRNTFFMPIAQGPFYALKTTFFASVCHGGITKNAKAEVTRFDGSAIPGLYAAGEVTATTNSNGYTISTAITYGRIAAQNAVEYMKTIG
ncbi:MAG: FAD-dependent oxidoreductase [Clostridia bacterium]